MRATAINRAAPSELVFETRNVGHPVYVTADSPDALTFRIEADAESWVFDPSHAPLLDAARITVPANDVEKPNREFLAEQFGRFQAA